jgi:hypothetical protein
MKESSSEKSCRFLIRGGLVAPVIDKFEDLPPAPRVFGTRQRKFPN